LCGVLLGVFSSFLFATKGVEKTVRYNDTRDTNTRATYYIIHELLLIKALRVMSAFDNNLSIFFCSKVTPPQIGHPPRSAASLSSPLPHTLPLSILII
jgi:hypothetical protein